MDNKYILPVINNNENKDYCSDCKGKCCKFTPGVLHPKQIGNITIEEIKELCDNGYIIDIYDGTFYIRPRTDEDTEITKYMRESFFSAGKCNFLTDNGCKLTFNKRPLECQLLVPNKVDDEYRCISNIEEQYSQFFHKDWMEYNDIIIKFLDIYI